jgi:hypothetical protein
MMRRSVRCSTCTEPGSLIDKRRDRHAPTATYGKFAGVNLLTGGRSHYALIGPKPHASLIRVGRFIRIAEHKRAWLEPSKRGHAVADAIRTVFINTYYILQATGQKSSAILAQPRNASLRFAVAICAFGHIGYTSFRTHR